MSIIAIVLWIICIPLSAQEGSRKGRKRQGVVLGVLLGPIGLLIIKLSPVDEAGAIASGTLRKCPACAEIVKAEASVCRYCGRELEPTLVQHVRPMLR